MTALRIAVLVAEPGQGSTGWALALAWSAAAARRVVLVDADAAGGRIASRLWLDADRSLAAAHHIDAMTRDELESQAEAVPGRAGLRVVPGFRRPGPRSLRLLEILGPALTGVDADLVVTDLGCPLRYPGLTAGEAAATAEAIGRMFHQVFVVVRVDFDLLELTCDLLQSFPLPRTRLVLCRPPRWDARADVIGLLREQLPACQVAMEWEWDRDRLIAAAAAKQVPSKPGMAEALGLFGDGRVVTEQLSRWPALSRLIRREKVG